MTRHASGPSPDDEPPDVAAGPRQSIDPTTDASVEGSLDPIEGDTPLEEVVAEQPFEAVVPLRSPLAIGGTAVAGFAMGMVEMVPGFSGGTVALVAGIYERLVGTIRQGARFLSLVVRGRFTDGLRALLAIDWAFAVALLVGLVAALFTIAPALLALIESHPIALQAVLIGLVLGAAVVTSRQLRAAAPWHVLLGVIAAMAAFFGLGFSGGTIADPSLLVLLVGGMIAISAWILPGVSGSLLLVVLGLWPAVLTALSDRDIPAILAFGVGCIIGLALFSTLLNWALTRAHDLVLAILIGLMIGSVRVLWPWPSDGEIGDPTLGTPVVSEALLAGAFALAAFAIVWMFGLAAAAIMRRRATPDLEPDTDPA